MKNLLAIGIVGLAGAVAFYIFQNSQSGSEPGTTVLEAPVKAQAQADIKAQLTAPREVREVKADEAQLAMDAMGLWVSEGDVDWSSRSGSNGNYTFTDFNFEFDGKTFAAAEMKITGARLEGDDIPYFDSLEMSNVTLFTDEEDRQGSVGTVIISMPDAADMGPAFAYIESDDISAPLDYIEYGFSQDYDEAVPFPEIIVENLKTSETDQIRDRELSKWNVIGDEVPNVEQEPTYKTVENTLELGFVGLTKIQGTDRFSIQANNFRQTDHNYRGKKETTAFTTANLTGFKATTNPEQVAMMAWSQLAMPAMADASMEPAFQSMSILGFEHNQAYDQFRIDNASAFYSDTQGDRYSFTIDVPRVDIIAQPLPQGVNRWESGNPIRELGYDTATLSMSQRTSFDRSTGTIELENAQASMVDGFDISGSYRLENWNGFMSRFAFGMDVPEETPGLETEGPGIAGANMVFTDRGILDRVFAQQAEEQNITIEEAREFAKNGMTAGTMVGKSVYQQELMMSASTALSSLIDNGGTFTFSMQPSRVIRMDELGEAMNNIQSAQSAAIFGEDDTSIDATLANQSLDDILRLMNITFSHTP